MMPAAVIVALAEVCAPQAPPQVLAAIVEVESRGRPWAIGVNRGAPPVRQPRNRAEAQAEASRRLGRGENIDLGLAQINSANLARLGLDASSVFEPCRNLAAAGRILMEGLRGSPDSPSALAAALSRYNTGSPTRGLRNGYVGRMQAAMARQRGGRHPAAAPAPPSSDPAPAAQPAPPPAWDVFARAHAGLTSLRPLQGDR